MNSVHNGMNEPHTWTSFIVSLVSETRTCSFGYRVEVGCSLQNRDQGRRGERRGRLYETTQADCVRGVARARRYKEHHLEAQYSSKGHRWCSLPIMPLPFTRGLSAYKSSTYQGNVNKFSICAAKGDISHIASHDRSRFHAAAGG
jgi:hypothetical protein